VLTCLAGEVPTRVPEQYREVVRWSAKQLRPEHAREIAAWPLTVTLDVDGPGRALFCHATPRDDNEIFTRITPEGRVAAAFADAGERRLVVCGHTHMQFEREVGGRRIVNAGELPLPDVYEEERHVLDLALRLQLAPNLSAKLDAKNLLNAPYEVTQGTVTRSYYEKGRSLSIGLSLKR